MSKTLVFHLGPVQGFIASARRTRDYWAGSFLLSWLTAQAMKGLLDHHEKARIVKPAVTVTPRAGTAVKPGLPISDPIFAAVVGDKSDAVRRPPFLGSLGNRFTAEVPERLSEEDVKNHCVGPLLSAWHRLATETRVALFPEWSDPQFAWDTNASRIWQSQIGNEKDQGFWDIYWLLLPWKADGPDVKNEDWLGLRKSSRLPSDMRRFSFPDLISGPSTEPVSLPTGNFCTMMPGFLELSGEIRSSPGGARRQDEFWEDLRHRVTELRYGRLGRRKGAEAMWETLDLRPGERLCAPALVKRLFPILDLIAGKGTLESIIGWKPERLDVVAKWRPRDASWWEELINRRIYDGNVSLQEVRQAWAKQSLSHWPSVSYMASAHWIASVQRRASFETQRAFAKAILDASVPLALAEDSLDLACTRDESGSGVLCAIDGALYYPPRLKRLIAECEKLKGVAASDNDKASLTARKTALERAEVQRKELTTQADCGLPGNYYALLRMDGDKAGELLDKDSNQERAVALLQFAEEIRGAREDASPRGLIGEHNGVVLFAGGDDLLAVLPIEDALPAAMAVREAYEKSVSAAAKPDRATISAAITLAHRQAPLRAVLEANREQLEGVAKTACKRNSLVLGLSLQGGVDFDWGLSWDRSLAGQSLLARLSELLGSSALRPIFAGNPFYHRIRESLAAFFVDNEGLVHSQLVKNAVELSREGQSPEGPYLSEADLAAARDTLAFLLIAAAGEEAETQGLTRAQAVETAETLIALSRVLPPEATAAPTRSPLLSLAPIKMLRVVARNWRKLENEDAARGEAELRAIAPSDRTGGSA